MGLALSVCFSGLTEFTFVESVAEAGEAQPAPPPAPIVRELEIRGNQRVDKATILRMIRTRVGRPFDERVWNDDWDRLRDSGLFLNVRTTKPIPWPLGVKLVIEVVEFPTITKIVFKGNKSISRKALLGAIKSTEDGKYDEGQVHLDARAIEKHYKDKAFRNAKASYATKTVTSHKQRVGDREVEVLDEVQVTFKVDEGNPISVRRVYFKGNKAFSEAQLQKAIQTKGRKLFRPGDLKDLELETDKKRLRFFYLRSGYMDVEVNAVDVKVSKETYFNWWRKRKKMADVTFEIKEGPQYRVGHLKVSGNKTLQADEITAAMNLRSGSVYSDLLLQDDSDRIKKLYGEFGRVFTQIRTDRKQVLDPKRTKDNPYQIDVEIMIREGKEVAVREVVTRGNTKTRDKVIIRELELFPGDRIDSTKIRVAEQRLKNLDYFEKDLKISYEPTENPEEADVIIDITEKSTGEFNFGAGVSSNDGVLGNLRLTQRNFDYRDLPKSWRDFFSGNSFVGAGQRASIEATIGTKRQNYKLSFYEPWAFDRPLRLGGSIFRTVDTTFKDFTESSTGMSITAGRRLWSPRWDGDLTYRFSFTDISDTATELPEIFQQQAGTRFLSSLTPRIVYSSRDSTILPSRGLYAKASVEIGGGPFFGTLDWIRPSIDVGRYFTVFKTKSGGKHILELRGSASLIEAYGDTDTVPPFQRYFGGGISTIRGFENRTIAPLQDGVLVGGKKMYHGTAEYSVPLYQEIVRAAVFADAGEVWDAGNTDSGSRVTNESGLRASIGVGLYIRTPFSPAPVRVYFSRAISKNDQDREKTIDFTFGTRF